jgi:hypothetical protein
MNLIIEQAPVRRKLGRLLRPICHENVTFGPGIRWQLPRRRRRSDRFGSGAIVFLPAHRLASSGPGGIRDLRWRNKFGKVDFIVKAYYARLVKHVFWAPFVFRACRRSSAGIPSMRAVPIALALLLCCGCTHRQLTRSMVNQASTVMVIEYQMVLDNIAMFTANPNGLPWHVKIKDGTVQINDEGGVPELGVQWGNSPNFTRGVRAVRSVTEQWGADAVTDPRRVKKLQDVYRKVVGLPPAPDPAFFKHFPAFRVTAQNLALADGSRPPESIPLPPVDEPSRCDRPQTAEERVAQLLAQLESDVPTGWFGMGGKHDVPKNACYVGHYCDRYVWVMSDGVEGLSAFTLIILTLTELTPTETTTSRGLMFTR